jgi:hypothetical protein
MANRKSHAPRKTNALKNGLLVLFSTLVALTSVEVTLRLANRLPMLPDENLLLVRADRFSRRPEVVHDPQLGWLPRSNMRAVRTPAYPTLTTGELGVRMNRSEISALHQQAILAVGDSFTQGSEVDDDATWPAQLERSIDEPVLNGGVAGYGTDQIVLRAEGLMATLAPKTIILSFLSSDISRAQLSKYSGALKPYFLVRDGQLVPMSQPVPSPSERTPVTVEFPRNLLGYSYLVTWTMARLGIEQWFQIEKNARVEGDSTEVTCLLLGRLKRETDRRNVRLMLVMQWPGEEVADLENRPPYAVSVLRCAVDMGMQAIDTWDTLKAAAAQRPGGFLDLYYRGSNVAYRHMTPAGNAVIADVVARAVRDPSFAAVSPPLAERHDGDR